MFLVMCLFSRTSPVDVSMMTDCGDSSYLKTVPSHLRSDIQMRSPGNGAIRLYDSVSLTIIGFRLIAICFLLLLY